MFRVEVREEIWEFRSMFQRLERQIEGGEDEDDVPLRVLQTMPDFDAEVYPSADPAYHRRRVSTYFTYNPFPARDGNYETNIQIWKKSFLSKV